MADIASLLANAAQTNANFDFGSLNKSYWGGLEEAYKQRSRDAFQDPSLYGPNGQIIPEKAVQKALQVGGLGGVDAASKLSETGIDLQRVNSVLQYLGIGTSSSSTTLGGGGGSSSPLGPPSTSRNTQQSEPSVSAQGGNRFSSGDNAPPSGQPTVMMAVSGYGVPNDQLQNVSAYVARQLQAANISLGPNGMVNMNDPATKDIFDKSIAMLKERGMGQVFTQGQAVRGPEEIPPVNPQVAQAGPPQVVPPAGPQVAQAGQLPQGSIVPTPVQTVPIRPQPAQVPQDVSAQRRAPNQQMDDPTLGGLISNELLRKGGGTPQGALNVLDNMALLVGPKYSAPFEKQAQAIRDQLKYTEKQKEAIAAGIPFKEYIDRPEEAKQAQAVLEKTMPIIIDSFKEAKAAKTGIQNIYNARTQLDTADGVITGKWSEDRLNLLKIAALVGADTSKIDSTETFNSQMKQSVLEKAKLMKGNLSDKDIGFLNSASGNSSLNEGSIRRMLDLSEQADRTRLKEHSDLIVRSSKANDAIKNAADIYRVDTPTAYQKPAVQLKENQIIFKGNHRQQVRGGKLVDIP